MDPLTLCCLTCMTLGDPTAVLGVEDRPGLDVEVLAATRFVSRSEAPQRRSFFDNDGVANNLGRLVSLHAPDGLDLEHAQLALSGTTGDLFGALFAVRANSDGLEDLEAYGDVQPMRGFTIRAGRWQVNTGAVSGRRLEQRCFTDAPLHTERFLGPEGLVDHGVRLRWMMPWYPIALQASVLSGQGNNSFGFGNPAPPTAVLPASGEGADLFDRLLYVLRGQVNVGHSLGAPLWVGLTFATGINGTGPGNRTDLIGADVSTVFAAGPTVIAANLEYAVRRYSLPPDLANNETTGALYIEGGLTADMLVNWKALHAGARLDLMGLPNPPTREEVEWRLSLLAGYQVEDTATFRVQYAARNDTPDHALGHEVQLQAIIGIHGRVLGQAPHAAHEPEMKRPTVTPREVPKLAPPTPVPPITRPTVPKPAVPTPMPPSSEDPKDWLTTARGDTATANKDAADGRHASAAFHAQQAAHKALVAVAIARGVDAARQERGATGVVERLTRAGYAPPSPIQDAARELDRHYTASRYPSELGGRPDRYYDNATSQRLRSLAKRVIGWADLETRAPVPVEAVPLP
ncbi:MAG: HEPN domain-containing protein [Myxococcota bacterium]|jgi:HEPN domain-containing protein